MSLFSFRHCTFSYSRGTPNQVLALHDISLDIAEGERVAVVGPPLAGKSTLVQAAAGLLPVTPGSVFWRELDLASVDRQLLRRAVGLLFQESSAQVVEDVVGKDVAFGPTALGLSAPETRTRVEEALNAVGLPYSEFRLRYVHSLSGGQLRRVALAGVLALHPSVLILDEPAAGLDPAGRAELESLLAGLVATRDVTLLLCSTGLTGIALLCDRVVVLDRGRVLLDDSVREVLRYLEGRPDLDISLPDAALLARDLRSALPDLPSGLLTLEELAAAVTERLHS